MIPSWGGGVATKKPKTTANLKFKTVFSVFPILTGLMGSG